MKKVFWLIIAGGILAVLLVMWMIVSMLSNMSFGISIGFGSLGIWLALAMVAVWAYLKHKKSGLAWIAGWVAIALLLFVWFGPTRTSQIAQGTGVVLDSVADSVTSVVTTGTLAVPPQPVSPEEQARRVAVAKQEAEVAEAQRLATIAAEKQAEIDAQRAYDESFMPAVTGPCIRVHTKETDCKTVKFTAFTQYDHYAPPGSCVMADETGLEWIPLGSGWHRYRVTQPTVAQFFTAKGARCAPNQ